VGVVGLLGSGRSELLLSIFGALSRGGTVTVDGKTLPPGNTKAGMAAGLALVPEDRLGAGAFLDQSISENLSIGRTSQYFRRGLWRSSLARRDARDVCQRYGVKSAGVGALLSTLSGGNQQKVVLARWVERHPKVFLLDEPTQGVDVTSRAEIYRIVRDAADEGAGVLVASSDFEELANLCDRVIAIRDGVVAGGARQPLTVHNLVELAEGSGAQ
jgi:ribose transport system ATP-binding protein